MNDKEAVKYFEDKFLRGTCFDTLKELKEDKTLVQINAPRALIAVELMGVWRGLKNGFAKLEAENEKLQTEIVHKDIIIRDLRREIENQRKEIEYLERSREIC
jgi:hypothetical protein